MKACGESTNYWTRADMGQETICCFLIMHSIRPNRGTVWTVHSVVIRWRWGMSDRFMYFVDFHSHGIHLPGGNFFHPQLTFNSRHQVIKACLKCHWDTFSDHTHDGRIKIVACTLKAFRLYSRSRRRINHSSYWRQKLGTDLLDVL